MQDQAGIKASLLLAVVREPVTSVINMEADVIAFIARTELPNNKWTELLPWLHACCTAADTKHQVIGMRVLKALLVFCKLQSSQCVPYGSSGCCLVYGRSAGGSSGCKCNIVLPAQSLHVRFMIEVYRLCFLAVAHDMHTDRNHCA